MPRTPASEQARRLLVLIGHLTPGTEIPLSELADTLGVSAEQVAADLELLSLCGVFPYDPGCLVPLYVEDDIVHVYGEMPALERRVRLSAAEARALAAALQAAGRPAADGLVGRLLEASSETRAHDVERLIRAATDTDPDHYATLALATERHEVVRIRHQSGGREQTVERIIEPYGLLNERGVWYVEAFCRRAGDIRTFRVDRIREADRTGERFEPRPVCLPGTALDTSNLPRAVVRLDPGVEVPDREWPAARVVSEGPDGTVVSLPYAGTAWIARQVAAFMGTAEVIEPDEVRRAIRELAEQGTGE